MAEPTDTGLKVDQGALGKRYQKQPAPIQTSDKNFSSKSKPESKNAKAKALRTDTVELSAAYYQKKAQEEKALRGEES